jgi:hypothetical protein
MMTLPVARSLPWNHTTYDIGVTVRVRTAGPNCPSVIAKDYPLESIKIKRGTMETTSPGRTWDDVSSSS